MYTGTRDQPTNGCALKSATTSTVEGVTIIYTSVISELRKKIQSIKFDTDMMPHTYNRTGHVANGINNFWYRYSETCDTTLVFVHGIFSDSKDCWTARTASNSFGVYWPDLVVQDQPRIGEVNLFMGGFFTAVDAGSYDIFNCSQELFSALSRVDEFGRLPALRSPKIVFVCHSTGGIVVRHLLQKNKSVFAGKSIGLALIASPSSGSDLASMLSGLAEIYNSKLASQLATQSFAIEDLDRNFKDLVHDADRGFNLTGVEAYENRFILHRKWLPNKIRVVTEASAGKYFGAPVHLAKTDHFTAVKPQHLNDPSHLLLVDLFQKIRKTPPQISVAGPSLAPMEVRHVNSQASSAPLQNAANGVTIKFLDLFSVDQISLAEMLQNNDDRRAEDIEIIWPKSLTLLCESLRAILTEIATTTKPEWCKNYPNSSIADLLQGASNALNAYQKITAQVERRLPTIVESLSRMPQYQIAVDFTPPRSALGNFLALAVWRAGLGVAYWASFEPIRNRFDLSGWEKILRVSTNQAGMGLVLGSSEEVCSARVTHVGDLILRQNNYEYLYGPKSAVIECGSKHGRMFPTMRWHYNWIIPQVELLLAERDDLRLIKYDNSITTTGVVKDQLGQEIYWSVISNKWTTR